MLTSQHMMEHATAHTQWIQRLRRQSDRRMQRQFVASSAGKSSLSLEVVTRTRIRTHARRCTHHHPNAHARLGR
jgi:hypothetical protein